LLCRLSATNQSTSPADRVIAEAVQLTPKPPRQLEGNPWQDSFTILRGSQDPVISREVMDADKTLEN
jgi:hypothetical protein